MILHNTFSKWARQIVNGQQIYKIDPTRVGDFITCLINDLLNDPTRTISQIVFLDPT